MALKLYNLGCSFAYGNCAVYRDTLCSEHKSIGTVVARHLGYEEVNLARNGNSIDSITRRLFVEKFESNCFMLIGLPPAGRFQVIDDKSPQNYNKIRARKSSLFGTNRASVETIMRAFTMGPSRADDYFYTHKLVGGIKKFINTDETASYQKFLNILLIQKRLQELNIKKYCIYNSLPWNYQHKNKETETIRKQIDYSNYYRPDYSLFDLIKTDTKYELADGDQHPNHQAYEVWGEELSKWIEDNK